MLNIEVGKELLLPEFGVAITIEGHSRSQRFEIRVREIPRRTEQRVRTRRKRPRKRPRE